MEVEEILNAKVTNQNDYGKKLIDVIKEDIKHSKRLKKIFMSINAFVDFVFIDIEGVSKYFETEIDGVKVRVSLNTNGHVMFSYDV
jgi:hypothetical protein